MGFTFFVLLLGALLFTLVQKSSAQAHREEVAKVFTVRGPGTDNIYQFKIYCYNMRCLLALAQADGIGDEWEPDEAYYDDYKDEISKRYCGGEDPVRWCMNKAIDTVMDHNYLSAWQYDPYGEEYYDNRDIAKGIHVARRRYQGTWTAFQSGHEPAAWRKQLKGIELPKDGKTGADFILKALYNFNHSDELLPASSPLPNTLSGYRWMSIDRSHGKLSCRTFEEANIHL